MSSLSKETVSFSYMNFYLVAAMPWIYTEEKHRKLLLEILSGDNEYICRILCGKYIHCFSLNSKPPRIAVGSWTFSSSQWTAMSRVLDKIFSSVHAPVELHVDWNKWTIVSPAIGLSLPCTVVE